VREDGWLCVRQARERLAAVVGTRESKSYGAKSDAFALVYIEDVFWTHSFKLNKNVPARYPSHFLGPESM
jgi:hypothetical protein